MSSDSFGDFDVGMLSSSEFDLVVETLSMGERGEIEGELPTKSFSKKYTKEKELGKGAYGVVYKVKEKRTGNVYAAKGFFNKNKRKSHLYEIKTMKEFSGECAGRVKEAFHDSDDDRIYVIMEYLEGEDMFSKATKPGLKNFDKPKFIKLFECVKKLHSLGFVHRDIKLDNIMLLKNGDVKLIDFGLTVDFKLDTHPLRNIAGTPQYFNSFIMPRKLERYTEEELIEAWKFTDFWCLILSFYSFLANGYIYDSSKSTDMLFRHVRDKKMVVKDIPGEFGELLQHIIKEYKWQLRPFELEKIIERHIRRW